MRIYEKSFPQSSGLSDSGAISSIRPTNESTKTKSRKNYIVAACFFLVLGLMGMAAFSSHNNSISTTEYSSSAPQQGSGGTQMGGSNVQGVPNDPAPGNDPFAEWLKGLMMGLSTCSCTGGAGALAFLALSALRRRRRGGYADLE
ncbi:unnamed protein product, partial [Heterosigma akashiwo]